MPYLVRHVKGAEKPWKIVNRITGKVVGSSTSKAKAEASIRARNAAKHGYKLTGRKGKG